VGIPARGSTDGRDGLGRRNVYLACQVATTASASAVWRQPRIRAARTGFTLSRWISESVLSVHRWVAGPLFQYWIALSVIGERCDCRSRSSASSAAARAESAAGGGAGWISLPEVSAQVPHRPTVAPPASGLMAPAPVVTAESHTTVKATAHRAVYRLGGPMDGLLSIAFLLARPSRCRKRSP
jgi:hypothetical protein